MITLQVEAELEAALDIYRAAKPLSILEIGVYQGGTLKAWMDNAAAGATFVAIDSDLSQAELDPTVLYIEGESQLPWVQEQIRSSAPYDWVFIDGDHGANIVAADVELALPLLNPGAHLLLHDIVDTDGSPYPPGHLLNSYEANGATVTRIICEPQSGYDGAHGIGIIHR